MKTSSIRLMVLLSLLLQATPTSSAEESFKFPNINPFRSKAVQSTEKATENKFRLPSLPAPPSLPKPTLPALPALSIPKFELPKIMASERRSTEPSAWDRFNRSGKQFLTKTKTTLMPWSNKSAKQAAPTGTNPYRVARRPEKQSFMSNLFGTQEEEPEIDSVNKYLALPRPAAYE